MYEDFKDTIAALNERIRENKKKLEIKTKVWEAEMRLRIESKIAQDTKAIEILKKHKDE